MPAPLLDFCLHPLKTTFRRLLIILTLTLTLGAAASYWTAHEQDRIMRKDLLIQAHLVAHGIDVERIRRLSGTEDDLFSPDYQRIKDQLALVRSATPRCRFIYLLGQGDDGTLFFFLDSESPTSKDYSPPGQTYVEASEACRRIFTTGEEVVEGPVTDRWGTWVSAFTPLKDARSGKVLAVLGLDVASVEWKKMIALRCAVPIASTIVLALIFTVFFIIYDRSEREKKLIAASKAAIEASERNYRSVVDNIQDVFFRVDREGRLTMMSPSGAKILGFESVGDLLGKTADIIWVKPELRADMVAALHRAGQIRDWEFEARRKDNTTLIMAATLHCIRDERGNPAGYEGILRDITERKRLEAELIQTAITDPLTGVYNRRHFHTILEMETGRVGRYATALSLIMFDIDHFKTINDTFGHEAGDMVLKGISALVRHRIRRADVLCRWGGEEFLVLCPSTTLDEAVILAQSLLDKMRSSPFPEIGRPVTASFGVTDYHSDEAIDDLLKRVDNLVYKAKNEGRNCVRSAHAL